MKFFSGVFAGVGCTTYNAQVTGLAFLFAVVLYVLCKTYEMRNPGKQL